MADNHLNKVEPSIASAADLSSCLVDSSRIEATLRTKYWKWVFHDRSDLPPSLFTHLSQALHHIELSEWSARADFGGIYINGYPALKEQTLPCPCMVEYYEPKFDFNDARSIYPSFKSEYVLFADGDLAVVFKPPKLPTMPAKEQRHFSLKASVEHELGLTVHMPSRLDVSVQGLVVMSTSQRMHAKLQHIFENRLIEKEYRFRSHRIPLKSSWECAMRIDRDPLHPVLRRVVSQGGQAALTTFSVIGTNDEHPLLRAFPHTGRTHQIRVHAAHSGVPILGDNFYGGATAQELALASYRVSFTHPLVGADFEMELPESLWPQFLHALHA